MEHLLKKLQNLSESDFYPYHMPGHKRFGNEHFALDITEIDGFDNLHHATGVLKDVQNRAAKLYGAKESFFLVNGSTCGLLAAIFASFNRGDKVLVARNCHKAVYHAIEIRGLEPVYIYPETDDRFDIFVGITAEQVRTSLESLSAGENANKTDIKSVGEDCDKVKGVILTSPTYEGCTSEISRIAELIHSRDMVLIVDEAHGAHFGFHELFPESAIKQGADIVIQSLHKTLPSMTQTALLHQCTGRVEVQKIQKYLAVFQTSSPSYVLMGHMDECICLLEEQGNALFETFVERLKFFYDGCKSLRHIKVRRQLGSKDYSSDPGKIIIQAESYTGKELYDMLIQQYHLQPEMCAGSYALAIMTISDTQEGFERLYEALTDLDKKIDVRKSRSISLQKETLKPEVILASLLKQSPIQKYRPWETETKSREAVCLTNAAGRVSTEYIYLYPPGIPFIVPGEVISCEMLAGLLAMKDLGHELQGMEDMSGKTVKVVI